jgi:glycosyltransferase involved in cell wall biosynthesis
MDKSVSVVIPAYNEARTIAGVIRSLKTKGYEQIIVVDDGSVDETGARARQEGAVLVRHVINRGLGGALATGIKAALRSGPEIIVTFDADGQHDPEDIPRIIEPIKKGKADVVIGSRWRDEGGVPTARWVAHRIANLVTYLLFGLRTTDSQSGLRAFSQSAAEKIRIVTSGMEVSSEILAEVIRKHLRWEEVPIRAIYTDYSLSKGQSLKVGLRTLGKLILAKIRRSTL